MLLVREGSTYEPADCGIQRSGSNHGIIEHFIRAQAISLSSLKHKLTWPLISRWGVGVGTKAAVNPAFPDTSAELHSSLAMMVLEMENNRSQISQQQKSAFATLYNVLYISRMF